ncbi:MAG: tRNA (N6-isopentenyl adenosine(37)-C2)-methylthiotransferase MiaB [Bdellovibrionales bacterium]
MTQRETPQAQNHDIGAGRGVYISTYGCQMNVNDTERMYSLLEMANFTPVSHPEEASLIIINSCSIREKPVHKVYSEVGTYQKLKNKRPDLLIGVGGCVGQQEKEKLIKNQPLIDFVFGTDAIDELPQTLHQLLNRTSPKEKVISTKFHHREPYHVDTLVRNPGVSTFVNITKGCDNFCSFCVVPFTRGREKSRPLDHVISDVRGLVKRGVKEVTLLGQNVNSYESHGGEDFADLLKKVATDTDIERIRFTTSHPKDFDQKLVDVMREHQTKICEYIHLPFQSGNSRILNLMNRGYTREEYLEKIKMIKASIPGVVLSTDIIVGFPGETEEEFLDTVSLVKEVGFETIFAFKYSPRPNTKAAQFTEQISEDVKSERLNRLFAEHEEMAFELVKTYEGRTLDVLVEKIETGGGKLSGRSTQNKLVFFEGPDSLIGQTVPVKITRAMPSVFRGELVVQ